MESSKQLGPTRTLLLQGTSYCSLDCDYCYLRDRSSRAKMEPSTARAALRWVEKNGLNRGGMSILWHSGEPLSLPVSYYREVFALARSELSVDAPARLELQTNGISINDAFCELFCEYDVSVGVSIDGHAGLHDLRRRTKSGRGTHAAASRGFELLQKWGLDPVVYCVVTLATLEEPQAFIDYFETLGAKMICLNFEELKGNNRASSLGPGIEERLRQFLDAVYERCRTSSYFAIREFHGVHNRLGLLSSGTAPPSSMVSTPLSMVMVDCSGNISTFSPELLDQDHPSYGSFILGNVFDHSAQDLLESPQFKKIHRDIALGLEACRQSCPYFALCGGGVPANKLGEHGTFATTATLDCRIRVPMTLDVISRFEARHGH